MGNMSYCRWENTAGDFEDCYRSLLDEGRHEEMFDSTHEWRAKKRFVELLIAIEGTGEWEEELAEMKQFEEDNKEE